MMRRPGPPTPEQQVEKIFTSYLQKKDPEMRFLIFNNANEEQKKCLKQFMVSQPYFDKRAFYLHRKGTFEHRGKYSYAFQGLLKPGLARYFYMIILLSI